MNECLRLKDRIYIRKEDFNFEIKLSDDLTKIFCCHHDHFHGY